MTIRGEPLGIRTIVVGSLLLLMILSFDTADAKEGDHYSVYEIGYLADGFTVEVGIRNLMENESIRIWPGMYNTSGFYFDDNDSFIEVGPGENTTYTELNQYGEIRQYGFAIRLSPVGGGYPDVTDIDVEMTITAYDLLSREIPRGDLLSYDAVALRYQENQLELQEEPPEEEGICGSTIFIGTIVFLISLIAIVKVVIVRE